MTTFVAYLGNHGAVILKSRKLTGSCKSTLTELVAGFQPGVVVGVADVFEFEARILQKKAAKVSFNMLYYKDKSTAS
jgi:hypothetical protein